jgi:D-beta-D-heptose 7-phosphate kinase/D-beta-D-heptose 1-phosphate adenosyltransferase
MKGDAHPIVPGRQRAEVLAALACVDWVVSFREPTPAALIRALRPDVLAKGGDWKPDQIVGRHDVESWGGEVVRLRVIPGVRTSRILARTRNNRKNT